jgi:hypothetical protein
MRPIVRDEPRRTGISSRADGSIAVLGSLSTATPGPTRLVLRWGFAKIVVPRGGLTLVLANRRGDSIDVEVVGPADSLPELVKILDDGVPTLHDGFSAGSSSGVQMIGGTNPSERQTASMVLRITAFARCLQFHVSRYVISWAAAIPM